MYAMLAHFVSQKKTSEGSFCTGDDMTARSGSSLIQDECFKCSDTADK